MKQILLLVISHALLCGQSIISVPRIGVLDYYGLHKITPTRIQRVLATKEGDPFPASKGDLEAKLTHQLQVQGIFPRDKSLQEVCSAFKYLDECVASLRISRTLQIDLTCLKWDVTGVKPKPVSDSCAGPAGGKAMPLHRAIDLLKPDSDAGGEARNALRRAHDDIKDAGG